MKVCFEKPINISQPCKASSTKCFLFVSLRNFQPQHVQSWFSINNWSSIILFNLANDGFPWHQTELRKYASNTSIIYLINARKIVEITWCEHEMNFLHFSFVQFNATSAKVFCLWEYFEVVHRHFTQLLRTWRAAWLKRQQRRIKFT